jgi:hypothetical protein
LATLLVALLCNLASSSAFTEPGGRPSLSADGRTMYIRVQVTLDGGAAATVERVFQKQ